MGRRPQAGISQKLHIVMKKLQKNILYHRKFSENDDLVPQLNLWSQP